MSIDRGYGIATSSVLADSYDLDSLIADTEAAKAAALAAQTAAETAKTGAETAETASELALDTFDDRYLGAKSSDPSVDNDGDTLIDGAMYFDTTNNLTKIYDLATTSWLRTTPTTADQTNIDTVSDKATEIGRLGTTDAVADMAILGTADVVTDMNTLGTADVVSDMNTLGTADVVSDMNILATADVVSDMNVLATADIVSDMNVLATADVVADMNTLATADVVADMNLLATSDIISDLNTLATSDIVTDMNLLATSDNVTAMGLLGTSAVITDMGLLGTTAAVADMAILGTTAAVADMAILGTTDVVADLAILGTTDVVSDLNTLGTADVVSDLNTLGTSDVVSDMNTLAGISSDITTVATNEASVSRYSDEYTISASAPGSPNEGDLWADTTANVLKHYNGTSWAAVTAVDGLADVVDDTTPQLGGNLDMNSKTIAGVDATEMAILEGATVTTAELNLLDGVTSTTTELNYTDGVTSDIQTQLDAKVAKTSATGSAVLPSGTTVQRDGSPSAGYIRWNTTDTSAEVYDGSAWAAVGGGNSTTEGLYEHAHTINTAYSITSTNNAMSAGPVVIGASGSVTVPATSVWTIV